MNGIHCLLMGLIEMNINVCRKEIWFVDLDPTRGHQQAKKRPCLIISPNLFNQGPAELAVVLPITSRARRLSWFVPIPLDQTSLSMQSYIMCNQIRTVSMERFTSEKLGMISDLVMAQVESRLRILLDL